MINGKIGSILYSARRQDSTQFQFDLFESCHVDYKSNCRKKKNMFFLQNDFKFNENLI